MLALRFVLFRQMIRVLSNVLRLVECFAFRRMFCVANCNARQQKTFDASEESVENWLAALARSACVPLALRAFAL